MFFQTLEKKYQAEQWAHPHIETTETVICRLGNEKNNFSIDPNQYMIGDNEN